MTIAVWILSRLLIAEFVMAPINLVRLAAPGRPGWPHPAGASGPAIGWQVLAGVVEERR